MKFFRRKRDDEFQSVQKSRRNARSLRMEALENRELLDAASVLSGALTADSSDVIVVNTLEDNIIEDEYTTLREAVIQAVAAETPKTIVFDSSFASLTESERTIKLVGGEFVLSKTVTIDATDVGNITIDAQNTLRNKSRIFNVTGGTADAPVTLKGLTLTKGNANYGGAIYVAGGEDGAGVLYASNCVVQNNRATVGGGGVAVLGDAYFENVSFKENRGSGNSARGVAIYCESETASIELRNCLVINNHGRESVVFVQDASFDACFCTFANNGVVLYAYTLDGDVSFKNSIVLGAFSEETTSFSADYVLSDQPDKFVLLAKGENNLLYDSTKTLFLDGTCALTEDSQARDIGDNSEVATGETDYAGNSRVAFERVDLGAYEYHSRLESVTSSAALKLGLTLTAERIPEDATVQYQWYRGDEAIEGAVEATYVPTVFDVGEKLTVVVSGVGDYTGTVEYTTDAVPYPTAEETIVIKADFDYLERAVEVAASGGTITFEYSMEPQIVTLESTLVVDKDLTINGTGANVVFSNSRSNSNDVVCTTGEGQEGNMADHRQVIELFGTTELEDLTFTFEIDGDGAAIYNSGALILKECLFRSCVATGNGGAIYNCAGSTCKISYTSFSDCNAGKNGGAMFCEVGSFVTLIADVSFTNCSARNGGAVANYGTITVEAFKSEEEGVTFTNNRATRYGGAYFGCGKFDSSAGMNMKFSNNSAGYDSDGEVVFSSGKGGAIYNDVYTWVNSDGEKVSALGALIFAGDVEFSYNKAAERGGAIMTYSRLEIYGNSTFTGNSALKYGGAIDVGKGATNIGKVLINLDENGNEYFTAIGGTTTFSGNVASGANGADGFGGAIFSVGKLWFLDAGVLEFTDNVAAKSGGAIDACDGSLIFAGDCSVSFSSNEANGSYSDDKSGIGGAIVTAAETTISTKATFDWSEGGNSATYGNCVAIDTNKSNLGPEDFGLASDPGADYSAFNVIRTVVAVGNALLPTAIATTAVTAELTVGGKTTVVRAEGVTPEELDLDAGEYEALVRYVDENGETSPIYSLILKVDPAASLDVRETSIADGRGVRFNFDLNKEGGSVVSSWEISWGDGTTTRSAKLSNSWNAAHYYGEDGTYEVSLTVSYLSGETETFKAISIRTVGKIDETEAIDEVFEEVSETSDVYTVLDYDSYFQSLENRWKLNNSSSSYFDVSRVLDKMKRA